MRAMVKLVLLAIVVTAFFIGGCRHIPVMPSPPIVGVEQEHYAGPYFVDGGYYYYSSGGFYIFSGGHYRFHRHVSPRLRDHYDHQWRNSPRAPAPKALKKALKVQKKTIIKKLKKHR